jgi:tetraacyldisaccharide 4'-kinase
MRQLRQAVEDIIEGRPGPAWLERLLGVFAFFYGLAVRLRALLYALGVFKTRRAPGVVVSIGNLVAGGTGKTPMAIHTARLLRDAGYRVGVVSRGHGGSLSKKGGAVSDGQRLLAGPEEAGDEPYEMALALPGVPVCAGRDRARAVRECARRFGAEVFVLDDAFQHLRIARDVNVLLMDARAPFGNGRLLPRGSLREPRSQASRADLVVLTRAFPGAAPPEDCPGLPVFACSHGPAGFFPLPGETLTLAGRVRYPVSFLEGKPVFAFSGIARNPAFFETLTSLGLKIAGVRGFPDHHAYSAAEREELLSAARESGALAIATTGKDAARLAGWDTGGFPVFALETGLLFDPPGEFDSWLVRRMLELCRARR